MSTPAEVKKALTVMPELPTIKFIFDGMDSKGQQSIEVSFRNKKYKGKCWRIAGSREPAHSSIRIKLDGFQGNTSCKDLRDFLIQQIEE